MEEYIGIVKLFAGTYAPQNWAFCDGSTLPISRYTALFSILGTTYGGDGVSTFKLPDLRSSVPVGAGQKPGYSSYYPGQVGGTENVTLTISQMPAHTHGANVAVSSANATDSVAKAGENLGAPGNLQGREFNNTFGYVQGAADTQLAADSVKVAPAGSSLPVPIMQPYMAMNYIICINGLYPPRS